MNREKTKSTYLGLNDHHRVSWNDEINRACIALARLGFSIATIATNTGLTQNQVIYRCTKRSLSVTDYRNGTSPKALSVLRHFTMQAATNKKTG
jgi:hypothetical protein